jgi:hypothetical protein
METVETQCTFILVDVPGLKGTRIGEVATNTQNMTVKSRQPYLRNNLYGYLTLSYSDTTCFWLGWNLNLEHCLFQYFQSSRVPESVMIPDLKNGKRAGGRWAHFWFLIFTLFGLFGIWLFGVRYSVNIVLYTLFRQFQTQGTASYTVDWQYTLWHLNCLRSLRYRFQ